MQTSYYEVKKSYFKIFIRSSKAVEEYMHQSDRYALVKNIHALQSWVAKIVFSTVERAQTRTMGKETFRIICLCLVTDIGYATKTPSFTH